MTSESPTSSRPRVAIITPVFNSVSTLSDLLGSIDLQVRDAESGLFELVHIVLDAGSTDGSRELLTHSQKPWRTLLFQPDHGPADAINTGFQFALKNHHPHYLAWLNADDAYAPHSIARAIDTLQRHPTASFAFGHCPILDAHNHEIRKPITRFKELFFPFPFRATLQTINFVSQPATLFRASALQRALPLRTDLTAAWDYDLLLRLLHHGPAVHVPGNQPSAFFRWTPNSISGANFQKQFAEELAIAQHDAGPFSPQALLHQLVRFGIVTIYSWMR